MVKFPDNVLDRIPPAALALYKVTGCRWPMGDPHQPDFHYCNGEPKRTKDGKHIGFYCASHAYLARHGIEKWIEFEAKEAAKRDKKT